MYVGTIGDVALANSLTDYAVRIAGVQCGFATPQGVEAVTLLGYMVDTRVSCPMARRIPTITATRLMNLTPVSSWCGSNCSNSMRAV